MFPSVTDDSFGQKNALTIWNPKVHHLNHNSLPLVPIFNQLNPVQFNPLS
jgi:hypothetical protein